MDIRISFRLKDFHSSGGESLHVNALKLESTINLCWLDCVAHNSSSWCGVRKFKIFRLYANMVPHVYRYTQKQFRRWWKNVPKLRVYLISFKFEYDIKLEAVSSLLCCNINKSLFLNWILVNRSFPYLSMYILYQNRNPFVDSSFLIHWILGFTIIITCKIKSFAFLCTH